jgi:hypothetical protein
MAVGPEDFAYHAPTQETAYEPPGPPANDMAMTPDQFPAHLKKVFSKWTDKRGKPKE